VNGHQDSSGQIQWQIPHDLNQRPHTPGRSADRHDQRMIRNSFGPIGSHQLYKSGVGGRVCMIVISIPRNSLRESLEALVIERVLGGEYPTSGIQHHLVMESGGGFSARSGRTDRVVECR
jgi:hypothetical protein